MVLVNFCEAAIKEARLLSIEAEMNQRWKQSDSEELKVLRSILSEQKSKLSSKWQELWTLAQPIFAQIKGEDRVRPNRKDFCHRHFGKTIAPDLKRFHEYLYGNSVEPLKSSFADNPELNGLLIEAARITDYDQLRGIFRAIIVGMHGRGVGMSAISTWLAFVRPDLFMPAFQDTIDVIRKRLSIDFVGSASNSDVYLDLMKAIRQVSTELQIPNLYEAAYYFSKYGGDAVVAGQNQAFVSMKQVLESKKQVIFYGPIGIGKTYNAKQFAIWFLTGEHAERQEEIARRFSELQGQGVLEFVQFHPAYSYEDFVEGIRPEPSKDGIQYKVRPGIFKQFAGAAVRDRDHLFAQVGMFRRLASPVAGT